MARTTSIVREITVSYSYKAKPSELPQVTSSEAAFRLFLESWDKNKIEFIEQFKMILLNRTNRVLGLVELSTGGTGGTIVDKRVMFAAAIKGNARGIILAHNHPSGSLKPSKEDKSITEGIVAAGKILEVPVLDHLIITPYGYYSFANERLL
jgi:DNA repair protein RadC